MKETIRTQLAILALAGGIWFHGGLLAQELALTAEEPEQSTNAPSAAVTEEHPAEHRGSRSLERGPLVSIGHDVELKTGESAECVVVIGGSARVHGHVRDAAVAVFGDLDIDGEVGDAAVVVLGDLRVQPSAKIRGDIVAVGGKVEGAAAANIRGQPVTVDFPAWLKTWFVQCVLKLRPLSFQVGWVWAVAGVVFLIYLLIAVVFPRPIEACVNELTQRPATTFLMGLVAKLVLPVVIAILGVTGIGLVVVPFILAAAALGALVGKVGVLEWLGFQVGRRFGAQGLRNGLVALVIGGAIIALLYLVPVLGLLTFGIMSVWGLGVAVMAAFGGLRKELPAKPSAPPPGAGMSALAGVGTVGRAQAGMPGTAGPGVNCGETGGPSAATATMPSAPPVLPDALSYPKAGFWERMGAGFLDVVLVSIVGSIVDMAPLGLLLALAYFAGMWAWKGTTIGGIVLGLKVVRLDGQPVTFAVALVRALAAAFSIVVLFLGFLWIAWDADRQGWHDRIAGTVVLKLPRGTPLVCF